MAKTTKTINRTLKAGEPTWFDKLPQVRKDVICVAILYLIILVLFNKIAFNNMSFADSGDTAAHEGWSKAIDHLEETEHVQPLWIPYIFSGMPVFGAMIIPRPAYLKIVQFTFIQISKVIFFGCDYSWMLMHFFLAGAFMYLLARSLKFGSLPSMVAALTLMLNPYAIELAQAGHGGKLLTLSYIPLLLFMTIKLCEKRNFLYLGGLAVAVSTLLLADHAQMAFYGLFLVGLYLLFQIIVSIKSNPRQVMTFAGLFVVAVGLGLSIAAYEYLPTQEYAKYSIRGGASDDTPGGAATPASSTSKSGLDYDYATNWSFHPAEMMNYLIPSTFGFSSHFEPRSPDEQNEEIFQAFRAYGYAPLYWGWMPFTTSTVYIGILPIILAILAFSYRRDLMAIFLLIAAAILLLLSFGRYLPILYDPMFNYFPFFNKFRVPAMILHLIPVTIGILAASGMNFLMELPEKAKEVNVQKLRQRLMYAALAIAGILVLGVLAKSAFYSILSGFMFKKPEEARMGQQAVEMLSLKRFDVFFSDFIKFAVIACAILGAMYVYIDGKIGRTQLALALIVVLMVDLIWLDNRYINPKPQNAVSDQMTLDPALQPIQAESDTSLFRVYPVEDFEDNNMMFNHLQSVGGYSPAKLKIYQEMRDSADLDKGNIRVANMLGVKYAIREMKDKEGNMHTVPQLNPGALPRTWFVDSVHVAATKHEIFQTLKSESFDPRSVAILEKQPSGTVGKPDSAASSSVTYYGANDIEIQARTANPALLVLSEVYYPAGWKAFIDDQETEIYKTNYILRSIVVPPGSHKIEFRFEPLSYERGFEITEAGWGIAAIILLIGAFQTPAIRARFLKAPPAKSGDA